MLGGRGRGRRLLGGRGRGEEAARGGEEGGGC